jgi:hypothetical protein
MPYTPFMQTLLLTPTFLRLANAAGLDEEELQEIVTAIATEPLSGDLVAGTGGARNCGTRAMVKEKVVATEQFTISLVRTFRFSCLPYTARTRNRHCPRPRRMNTPSCCL